MSWSVKVSLAVLAATAALLWLLGPILMPFAFSAGLAYLGDPLVDRLQRYRISRTGAVIIVFVVLSAVLLPALALLVPLLVEQVRVFVTHVPDYLDWLQNRGLPALGIQLPPELRLDPENLKSVVAENLPQAGGIARDVLGGLAKSGTALLAFAAAMLLVPVVTFYLLRDWDRLVAWIDGIIPLRHRDLVRSLGGEVDSVLAGFLRGQLLVMLALSVIYSAGLSIVGLNLALLIGIGAGLVSFVPYLGFIAGILAATIAVLVQLHEIEPLAWVFLVFMIGQMVESMVLTPWLVGDRIGLHPVTVIFAVMAGGQLFGFVGVLLGLPAAAVIAVVVRHAIDRWRQSAFYLSP
ncbi:MAG TPA: AI-2E family transporter [Verrucomicrobiae bacterium]|nr:AI-2E family transporter [Verrucomicrobiae bacterium]